MKVTYLAHPIGAPTQEGVEENIARAKRWYLWACNNYPDRAFVMNYIVDIEVYSPEQTDVLIEGEPEHEARKRGLDRDDAVIAVCKEFWILVRLSAGVERGVMTAKRCWLNVLDLTALGDEPPEGAVDLRGGKVKAA